MRFLRKLFVLALVGAGLYVAYRIVRAKLQPGPALDDWQPPTPPPASVPVSESTPEGADVAEPAPSEPATQDALVAEPNAYVTFPAPAGPKGRGYMPVVAGLAIAKDAPNRPGAVATIDHLLKPETQVKMAAELGFFPVVKAQLPGDLSGGVKLLAEGVDKTQNARDAVVSLLPVGLGAKGGEFNKVYMDAFQRIVLRGEPARAALDQQAAQLKAIIDETKAPCWAPDKESAGACPIM